LAEFIPTGEARESRLDGRDPAVRRLLIALMADARRDPARLGALIGASADEVARLVDQLERQRVIRGYKTLVDWEQLGDERVVAFIDVSVSPQHEVICEQVGARM
jgi:DNA-binding Lrp family transcriptional regulator